MVSNNKHGIAMNIEALECVNRVDTGKDTITVVFTRSEHATGEYDGELNPECYHAVKDEIHGTVFQEAAPIGPDKVSVFPDKDEIRLRFVV